MVPPLAMEPTPAETEKRLRTACLLAITFILAAAALHWLRQVMIPLVLAIFIGLAVTPLMDLQTRRLRAPRGVAVVGTLVVCVVVLVLLGLLISTSVSQMAANADTYAAQIDKLTRRISEALPLDKLLETDEGEVLQPMGNVIKTVVTGTMSAIGTVLQKGILVLLFLIFILGGHDPERVPKAGIRREIRESIQKYLITKTVVSAITGVLVGVTLLLLGVDMAVAFGLFAFVLNFIPNIGSVISTLLPLPVVVLNPEVSTTVAILAIAIPGAIQFVIGNLLEPRMLGTSLDLHPVVILVSLIFWSVLWGPVGMLLAAPITAILRILFSKLELTAPLANVMAGRPPGG
jgi:AI-2 transport protein TqsA